MAEITRILEAIDDGDAHAAEELLPLVHDELRRLAAQKLSHERPGQTLQATALVHEAYVRLVGSDDQHWDSRGHFFAAAAEAMRKILVESARRNRRAKHGGDWHRVDLADADLEINPPSIDIIAVDEALDKLARTDNAKAELIKLRYFAGLTADQAASCLGISRRVADRHWDYARAWLLREIRKGDEPRIT